MKKSIALILIFAILSNISTLYIAASSTNNSYSCDSDQICNSIENKQLDGVAFNEDPAETTEDASVTETSETMQYLDSLFKDIIDNSLSFSDRILNFDSTASNYSTVADRLMAELLKKGLSRFDIIKEAYSRNIISEEEMIIGFCDILDCKLFDNSPCLIPVYAELSEYTSKASPALFSRISQYTSSDDESEISNNSRSLFLATKYQSENFKIKGDSGVTADEAADIANYMEDIRAEFSSLGFRLPINQLLESKYIVEIYSADDQGDSLSGYTTASNIDGTPRCRTTITIENYTQYMTKLESVLAHEYFHAIEAAYYWIVESNTLWFFESMATCEAILVSGSSTFANNLINQYLASSDPIYTNNITTHYGSALFSLTIYNHFGNGSILSIWNKLSEQPKYTGLGFNKLKNTVLNSILNTYDSSFDDIFALMAANNIYPSYGYKNVHPGGQSATSEWINNSIVNTNVQYSTINENTVVSGASVNSYANKYYKFLPNSSTSNAQLLIKVKFTGTNAEAGVCQGYYKRRNGTHTVVQLTECAPNTYIIDKATFGADIEWCGVIISNVGDSAVSYTITYSAAYGTKENLTIAANNSYTEKIATLGASNFKEYWVTFATAGNRIIQTFGADNSNRDGYLILYDRYGNKLTSDDDSGYENNALISYNFAANTQYRVRVCFYGSSSSGTVKVAFIPAANISDYESITYYGTIPETVSSSLVQNQAKLYAFNLAAEESVIDVWVESDIDTVLYIIDPTSTEALYIRDPENSVHDITASNIYSDDGIIDTHNPYIEIEIDPEKEYLIIVAAYDPAASSSVGSFVLYCDY